MATILTPKQFIDYVKDPKVAETFAKDVLNLLKKPNPTEKPKKKEEHEVKDKEENKEE